MENFDYVLHLIVPLIFGGTSNVFYYFHFVESERKSKSNLLLHFCTGGFAAMIATYMVNPTGTFFQIAVLSALVGLKGMAFLLKNSFVDQKSAQQVLEEEKSNKMVQSKQRLDVDIEEEK